MVDKKTAPPPKGKNGKPGEGEAPPKARADGAMSEPAREALRELQSGDVVSELEAQSKERTKTGKVSKAARDAQNQLDMMQILAPTLGALNELAAARWPEFRHTDEELHAITLAGSRVLTKYLDEGMMKYQDEIILATILGGSLVDKGFRYAARVKAERKNAPPPVQLGRMPTGDVHGERERQAGPAPEPGRE